MVAFSFAITSSGGNLSGRAGGTCASMNPDYAGCARDGAFQGTGKNVPHAVAIYIPEAHLTRAARFPALTWDRTNAYSGTLPMGSRFVLPGTVDLASRTWGSPLGYRMAQAAQDYGLIVVDRGGGTGMTFKNQRASVTDTQAGTYEWGIYEDLDWIRVRLKVVSP
jgi:hypothetical protein